MITVIQPSGVETFFLPQDVFKTELYGEPGGIFHLAIHCREAGKITASGPEGQMRSVVEAIAKAMQPPRRKT